MPEQSVEPRQTHTSGPSPAEGLEAVFCTLMDGTLIASWTSEDIRTDVASAMVATLTHSVEGILGSLGHSAGGPINVTVAGHSIHVERPVPNRIVMAIARHKLTRTELARSLEACYAALDGRPLGRPRDRGTRLPRATARPSFLPEGPEAEPGRGRDEETPGSELCRSGRGNRLPSHRNGLTWSHYPPDTEGTRGYPLPVRPPDTLVAHPCRRAILSHLSGEPGDHLRSIARDLALPLGSVRFHLAMLEKCGLVRAESRGGKARYFRTGPGSSAESNELFSRYWDLRDVRSRVEAAAARLASRDISRVAASVGISRQLASYHLRRLPGGTHTTGPATPAGPTSEPFPPPGRIRRRSNREPRHTGSTE